ncbi:hypothetical protein FRB96_000942 [Tulasnella sp. 330]|nr:hypothetical protein FRB96_000942 [Tulasnella sp. 330]KAG8872329.1 hypothetical protein FRB97_007759 [Tulasnella sp. 331]
MPIITWPGFISAPATAVLGAKCYTSLLENIDYSDVECIRLGVSKALGIGIIAGGSIVKVPQISIIWRSGSGRGVSLSGYVLELISCAINSVYSIRNGYAFSTYGENLFLTIQNAIVTLLIIHYKPLLTRKDSNASQLLAGIVTMAISAIGLLVLPSETLTILQGLTIPISAIAKVPQIISNERNKSTGNLAVFTVIANVLGCFARVFTTLTEVKDPLVLWGFILASILNTVIGVQMYAYWGRSEAAAKYRLPTEKTRSSVEEKVPIDTAVELKPIIASQNFPRSGTPEAGNRRTPPAYTPTARTPSVSLTATTPGGRKWARKVD